MIYFNCDYNEGAHPDILKRLSDSNFEQSPGYGNDTHCKNAKELILAACGNPDADIYFMVGGTPANLTTVSAALRPHQGVISADTGHINVHESGAIEATGHKVLALPGVEGKITAAQVKEVVDSHNSDGARTHTVQPKMVYISHPTELGTLYTKAELEALSAVCKANGLYLYLDGARMGYALTSDKNDLQLSDFAQLCDAFYIGGTKVGALFGEALLILNPNLKPDFAYIIKQKGGLLAKGRLLGIQFEGLFTDELYFKMGAHANACANVIRAALVEGGFSFLADSPTNQLFPILPNQMLEQLRYEFVYETMQAASSTHTVVRFCTSWATKPEDAEKLAARIRALSK